jgi:predicted enzyme related to lactoylglutathione lyase
MNKTNAITWFEIPTPDLDRARAFYQTILDTRLKKDDFGDPGDVMCVFPGDSVGVTGALIRRTFQKPGAGTTVYLTVDGQMDQVLTRIPKAGGSVLIPRTPVPGGMGAYACFRDSEGNCVGLHTTA